MSMRRFNPDTRIPSLRPEFPMYVYILGIYIYFFRFFARPFGAAAAYAPITRFYLEPSLP